MAYKRRNSRGYSLVELVLVFMCASILACAAIPSISHLQRQWTLWGSARALEGSLHWGRMRAVSSNTPLLFEIDANRREFYWVDPASGEHYAASVRLLGNGVHFTGYPKRPLRFYQHGNAAPAGTYTIEGDAGSYSVVVSPGGRIRVRRN